MIFGLGVFALGVFANPSTGDFIERGTWNEICPSNTEWTDIVKERSSIARCDHAN